MSEDSDNSIKWKQIGSLQLIKNAKRKMRWVMANKTSCYQVVLVCMETEDSGMDLEEMGTWDAALQEIRETSEARRTCFATERMDKVEMAGFQFQFEVVRKFKLLKDCIKVWFLSCESVKSHIKTMKLFMKIDLS